MQDVGPNAPQGPAHLPERHGIASAADEGDDLETFRRHALGESAAAPSEHDASTAAPPQTDAKQPRLFFPAVPMALRRGQDNGQVGFRHGMTLDVF